MATPILFLVAGPNGAGKSTFVEHVIRDTAPLLPNRGQQLFEDRSSFITETVFSHSSKVSLVKDALGYGYIVSLHIVLVPLDVSLARVAERVELGGHAVPENKIRERYERLWALVADATRVATETRLWDASRRFGFTPIGLFEAGHPIGKPAWPPWTPKELRELG